MIKVIICAAQLEELANLINPIISLKGGVKLQLKFVKEGDSRMPKTFARNPELPSCIEGVWSFFDEVKGKFVPAKKAIRKVARIGSRHRQIFYVDGTSKRVKNSESTHGFQGPLGLKTSSNAKNNWVLYIEKDMLLHKEERGCTFYTCTKSGKELQMVVVDDNSDVEAVEVL